MKMIVVVSLFLFSCFDKVSATSYFVDITNGSDNSNGLTPSTAWKTIAKVNDSKFLPGDFIAFKRGECWREKLHISSSGEKGKYITFGAYGNGSKPKIVGSEEFLGKVGDWTCQGKNVWCRLLESECKTVIFNNNCVGVNENGLINLGKYKNGYIDSKYDWYWELNHLYVYSENNPAHYYSSIQASQRSHSIFIQSDTNYVRLENLDARTANWAVISIAGCHNVVYDCCVSQNWYAGIYISKTGCYNEISNCEVLHTCREENQAITIEGHYTLIAHNKIHDNYNEGIDVYLGATHCEIFNNFVDNINYYAVGIYVDGASYVDIYGNFVTRSSWGIAVADEKRLGVSNVNIYYNLCLDNYNGVRIQDGGSNFYILNNVVYGGFSWGLNIRGNCSQTYIYNNIIYDSQSNRTSGTLNVEESKGVVIDYNCYYIDNLMDVFIQYEGKPYNINQFSSYQSINHQDLHSIAMDPKFIDKEKGDFRLADDSKLINSGLDVGLNEDCAGNVVPSGIGVDIGAFEYVIQNDIVPPIGTVTINNDEDVTYSSNVLLSLCGKDDDRELDSNALMTFSNNCQEWSLPEQYSPRKIWTLIPGSGEKTVYVKFRDAAGNWMAEVAEDKIIYEESQSKNNPPTGSVSINSDDYVTSSHSVFLTLFAIDDGNELDESGLMTLSNDGETWSVPEPYATGKIWTLSPGEGEKTVFVKFCDAAGNWMTAPAQDRIYYEASEITCDDPQNLRPVSATASSELLPRYSKKNAFDGNPLTAWSAFSLVKKDQFITLDLGEMKRLSGLNMYASRMFGTDFFPTDFGIEISRDNSTWASIGKEWGYTPPFQPPYADKWEFDGFDCRYLRINVTKSKTLFLFLHLAQIAEIELYGCDIEDDIPLITGQASAVSASQKKLDKIIIEDSIDTNQGELTTPGKPEVRFE